MKKYREKGYWKKFKERYEDGEKAQQRAGYIRTIPHSAHVKVGKEKVTYVVTFSIAKWYLAEMEAAGINW